MGLSRISLGNFLIKRVVQQILTDKPSIKNFYTLSPVPGFAKWLFYNNYENIKGIVSSTEIERICKSFDIHGNLKKNSANIKNLILKLCAFYLVKVKVNGKPINKVANFHLGNGAFINDVFWDGDISVSGLKSSFGIMVNYEYDLKKMDTYHESFFSKGEITMSKKVQEIMG